jgi:hypothetical protein
MAALRHYWRLADSAGHCELWRGYVARNLHRNAGVYPPEPEIFSRFCQTCYSARLFGPLKKRNAQSSLHSGLLDEAESKVRLAPAIFERSAPVRS